MDTNRGPDPIRAAAAGPTTTDLGRVPFATAHADMLHLHASVAAGTSPGQIWLVEHDPVFTAGRATPAADIDAAGAVPIERGGRITFHGPGQLVVYPIVPLRNRDVRRWLQALEQFGIDVCTAMGLSATASDDGTGVFVDGRKVASIGVALRRWVNLHGIAINYAMDLAPFFRVRPCGLDPEVMSDLGTCLGRAVTRPEIVAAAQQALPALLAAAGTAAEPQ
jgi:lipoyl(octanoyl) transferase